MSANAAKPAKIILTTDFSDNATCAFPYAAGLAKRNGSELVILHVVTGHSEYLENSEILRSYEEIIHKQAVARLTDLEFPNDDAFNVRREITTAWSPQDGIIQFAETEKPDLIVISTHGHRLATRLIMGSVAWSVIASAPCPVLCVKCGESGMMADDGKEIEIERILVPVDLSEDSRQALKLAADYVKTYDAQLHLMYVLHIDVPLALISSDATQNFDLDEEMHTHISGQLAKFHKDVDPEIEKVVTMVEKGSPAKQIARYAASNSIDLIIMSRKGLGRTSHSLGCVAGRLLHEAHCPTLVV